MPWLGFEIEANAFLFRMVRTVVGLLVLVGSGRLAVDEFEVILQSRDRSQVKQIAPAQGLYLTRVEYAADKLRPGTKEFCSEDFCRHQGRY
jgi:tRNA pseudouridine38-40 synthase